MIPRGCRNCGGDLYLDRNLWGGDDIKCLQCGRPQTAAVLVGQGSKRCTGCHQIRPETEFRSYMRGLNRYSRGDCKKCEANRYAALGGRSSGESYKKGRATVAS